MLLRLVFFITICSLTSVIAQESFIKPRPTKQVTGLDPKDVVIECYPKGLRVIIEKRKFQRIQSSANLHFLDPACIGGENETHFVASTPYRSCGVSKDIRWNGIVYSNTLMTGYPEDENFISKCPVVSIKFSCVFSYFQYPRPRLTRAASKEIQCEHLVAIGPRIRHGVLARFKSKSSGRIRMRSRVMTCPTLIGIGPPVTEGVFARMTVKASRAFRARTKTIICKPLKSTGIHYLELKAYKDAAFSDPIKDVLLMHHDVIDIYYEIRLKSPDSFLRVSPSRCYVTPNKEPEHSVQYLFIKDGCTNDDTVQFYQSPPGTFRFSIKSFQFTGYEDSMFYVHCDAVICDADDEESVCHRGCDTKVSRQRRDKTASTSTKRIINTGFSRVCKYANLQIAIERETYPDAEARQFQLSDPNCIASMNKTHFFFNIRRGKCGTVSKVYKDQVEISNEIHFNKGDFDVFSVPFKCKYGEKLSSSASRSILMANHRRYVNVVVTKNYYINTKVVFDPSISTVFSQSPLEIKTNELNGVLGISVKPRSSEHIFIIDHCKIKPRLGSNTKVTLIENGCVENMEQVFVVSSTNSSWILIDFKKFSGSREKFFVKCHFTVCHSNSPWSKCENKPCFGQASPHRGKRSTQYDRMKASVSCSSKLISVAIEKASVPRLQSKNLHLRINTCKASENSTHILFQTRPYECRTSVKSFGSTIEYSNIILEEDNAVKGLIRRQPLFQLPFKCIFVPRVTPGLAFFRTRKSLIKFSGISTGTYSVRLSLFSDSTFKNKMESEDARINPGSTMYFQVSVDSPNVKVALFLELCYGKPFFSANERDRYTFIRDNCAVDRTVEFHDSGKTGVKRFSLSPFEFSNKFHKSVFINCVVSACNPKDKSSRCFQPCPSFSRLA